MCGISGYIGTNKLNEKTILETLSMMKNRGPDHQAYKNFKFGNKNIYFLSSRLKIIDRKDRSNQPMTFEGVTIIYNGEIYNISEIKKIIYSKGFVLKTNSDTELILKMYMIFGTNCVNYFEGMWAFAIFDSLKQIVFISRDRIGEKPFYFLKNNQGFFFGSETKFIRNLCNRYNQINSHKIYNYLKFGYKSIEQTNESFFKNIFKLEPATNIILNKNFDTKFHRYWKPKVIEQKLSEIKCLNLIRENFQKKMKIICKSDLKIGLSLSGGIDSNLLLGFFKKSVSKNIHTYSIIDDQSSMKYNEEDLIDISVKKLKVKNTKIYLSRETNYFKDLKQLINYHDKPISTISYFLQSLIYKRMKQDNIKICITGNGADELFAGYYHHYNLFYNSLKKIRDKQFFIKAWKANVLPVLRNNEYKNIYNKNVKSFFTFFDDKYLKQKNLKEFKDRRFTKNILKNKMLNELFYQTMPLALFEDDLNSMYYSIENRSPFLNKDLVNLSTKIPTSLLMKNSYNKYLLRYCSKGFIDDRIRLNREKKGFNASFYSIFSFKDKKFKEWFFDAKSPIFEFINRKIFLKSFKSNYEKGFSDMNEQGLFNICSTKIFLENIS